MSKEEITCILSLLGDLRVVRHMVRADDRFTAIFAICIAVGRSIRAPCQRPLFRSFSSTLSHRPVLQLVSSPAFFFAHRTVVRLLFGKVHGKGHGRARLSLQFSDLSASTLDPGMRALARRNGFLHVRCLSALSAFFLFLCPRPRVCLFISANACMAWAATRSLSAPGVS